jgi:ribosomal protein L13E
MPTPKAEKTAKPRKATAKKTAAAPEPIVMKPTYEQIAALAQKYWAERGYSDGHAEHDWLRAEQDLMKAS